MCVAAVRGLLLLKLLGCVFVAAGPWTPSCCTLQAIGDFPQSFGLWLAGWHEGAIATWSAVVF